MASFEVVLVDSSATATAVPDWVLKTFAAEGIGFLVRPCESRGDLERYASQADVVWVWGSRVITAGHLEVLPRCGAIMRSGSGTDNLPLEKATEHGIVVANTP